MRKSAQESHGCEIIYVYIQCVSLDPPKFSNLFIMRKATEVFGFIELYTSVASFIAGYITKTKLGESKETHCIHGFLYTTGLSLISKTGFFSIILL